MFVISNSWQKFGEVTNMDASTYVRRRSLHILPYQPMLCSQLISATSGQKICFRSLEHHLNGSIELLLQHLDKLVDYKAMENSVAKVVVLVFLIWLHHVTPPPQRCWRAPNSKISFQAMWPNQRCLTSVLVTAGNSNQTKANIDWGKKNNNCMR